MLSTHLLRRWLLSFYQPAYRQAGLALLTELKTLYLMPSAFKVGRMTGKMFFKAPSGRQIYFFRTVVVETRTQAGDLIASPFRAGY